MPEGFYVGLGVLGSWTTADMTEREAFSGERTNRLTPADAAAGVSGEVGYTMLLGNRIALGAVVGLNAAQRKDDRRFPGGSSLATEADWSGSVLAKVGLLPFTGVAINALAGLSVANEDLSPPHAAVLLGAAGCRRADGRWRSGSQARDA
jgi:hypothetical protein